jgi:hypothetical protein
MAEVHGNRTKAYDNNLLLFQLLIVSVFGYWIVLDGS